MWQEERDRINARKTLCLSRWASLRKPCMVEKAGAQNGSGIHRITAEVGYHSGKDDPSERVAQGGREREECRPVVSIITQSINGRCWERRVKMQTKELACAAPVACLSVFQGLADGLSQY